MKANPFFLVFFLNSFILSTSLDSNKGFSQWRFQENPKRGAISVFPSFKASQNMRSAPAPTTFQKLTTELNVAINIRQQLTGFHLAAIKLLNQLIVDKVVLYEEKTDKLQRIRQLFRIITRQHAEDVFCEIGKPLKNFRYRWNQLLPDSLSSPKPRWIYRLASVSLKAQKTLNYFSQNAASFPTLISQVENIYPMNLKGAPVSILGLRGKEMSIGYIVLELLLHEEKQASSSDAGAGLVFKFQNEKEFGFVTLWCDVTTSEIPNALSGAFLIFGRMNQGRAKILSTMPVKVNRSSWLLIGVQFTHLYLRIYVNGNTVAHIRFLSPWVDGGTVGLHSAASKASFRNFITGPLGSESACGTIGRKALGYLSNDQLIEVRQWSPEEYKLFLEKGESEKVENQQKNDSERPNSTTESDANQQCYDFSRPTMQLSDWRVPEGSRWVVVEDPVSGSHRLYYDATNSNTDSDNILLLKNFRCKAASVLIKIYLYPQSEAGIIIDNAKDASRWISTLDSGFGVVKLTRIHQDVPTIIRVAPVPGLDYSELYQLEFKKSVASNITDYEVWLNGKCIIEHHQDTSNDVSETSSEEPSKYQGNIGILIGKGGAEISEFQVFHVVGFNGTQRILTLK